jgi:hypothetical protein
VYTAIYYAKAIEVNNTAASENESSSNESSTDSSVNTVESQEE